MSTDLVIKEIQRFLASERAEVLCIRGRWGVGKTFAWRRYLDEARKNGALPKQDYAYVSMFGLNALDDLRYAIFESTVPLDKALAGPDAESFGALLDKGLSLGRRSRHWLHAALAAVGLGEIGNALGRSAFLLVRNQLICLDDLERAGAGLEPRDMLGLVSFLKDQRDCRVVLLLNDEAMTGQQRAEFNRLLEKVVDISLVFAPTAAEAAAIAITQDEPIGEQLRRNVETLGITNIRVIKKIERLALRLAELLQPYRREVLNQAVIACALGGWAVFEPDQAPALAFIRDYNAVLLSMRDGEEPADVTLWRDRLNALPFAHADDFDRIVMEGIAVGYFNENGLRAAAKALEEAFNHHGRENSFGRAWDRYHRSLTDEDDTILDAIRQGALENLPAIEPININAAIHLLRDCGRDAQADDLARAYVAARQDDPQFFDLREHHFMPDQPIDHALRAEFEARYAGFEDERGPTAVLLGIGSNQGWSEQDERLLATLTPDAFEALIEGVQGPELRQIVRAALRVASGGGEHAPTMRASLHEALGRIAAKSPLRARRLRGWGFVPPAGQDPAPQPAEG